MRWFTRHPDDRELNRFADGELGERELARVSDHLARCPRCRGEVALVRRMGDSARTLPGPLATDEVLRRALARRAAGDRVLLPNSDAGAPPRRPITRFAPAAIAAMLTLMVASLVVSVRVLEADRPALRLYPERPAAGEALRVEYHGGSLFADQTHLKLRARFRTADDRHWQLLAGILVRDDDGVYRTEVQLPDSVVYAAFAVEDLHGDRLDSNNRELWDVMVHRDGQPTLDAMMARTWDLEPRDWGEAYQQTLRMTDAYPDAPQSWAARFSYELSLFDRDSVFAAHRRQFGRLEPAIAHDPRPEVGAMAWLGLYALGLGDLQAGNAWIRKALVRDPASHVGLEGQMILWSHESIKDPKPILHRLETLWATQEARSKAVANLGWQVAIEARDNAAARSWLDRYLTIRPDQALSMAPRAYRMSGGAVALGEWVESNFAKSQAFQPRPLRVTPEEHRRRDAELRQRSLAAVALEALRVGDEARAARLAATAVPLAWESTALLDLSTVLIETGLTSAAINALARAAADPMTAGAATRRASDLDPDEIRAWSDRSPEAERELKAYTLTGAIVRYVDLGLELRGLSGNQTLGDLLADESTVLALVSRLCAPALEELPAIAALAKELESEGTRLVVVDVDNTGDLQLYIDALGLRLDVYADHSGAARAELYSSATPAYFVLDSAGRVRFENSQLNEIMRQIEAITSGAVSSEAAIAE